MFTKHRRIGSVYKRETDWGAVLGTVLWAFIILGIIGAVVG